MLGARLGEEVGLEATRGERAAGLAQRFRIYQRYGYYRAGLEVDRDEYDRKAVYLTATVATGPLMLGYLTTSVFAYAKDEGPSMPFRYAGLTMCSVFILGLVVLPFLPETKDKPLPE